MTEFLQASARTEEYSIGANLVKLAPSRAYTIHGIHDLRRRSSNLIDDGDNDDKRLIKAVHQTFRRNDFDVARSDLDDTLDISLHTKVIEWIGDASDYDIERFCLWSLKRTNELSRSLLRDKKELIEHTLDKTEELVDIGLFPPIAQPVIRDATKRYYLQGLDTFHGEGMYRIAFCDDHRIGVSNLYTNRRDMTTVSKDMQRTLFHEYIHGGGNDRGFFDGITDRRYVRIMEEAFVEHATVVAHSHIVKQPRVIHPKRRMFPFQESSGTYQPERTFLAVACDHTGIAIEHLSEAYFSPRGDERGERLRFDIDRKIGKFFGSREKFYHFVDTYEQLQTIDRDGFVHHTIRHLQKSHR